MGAITCNDTRMICWYVIPAYITSLGIFYLLVIAGIIVVYIDVVGVLLIFTNSFVSVLVGIGIARCEVERPPLAECVV